MSKRSEERAARAALAAAAKAAGDTPPADGTSITDIPEALPGMVVLITPDDATGCSFNGENYEPDDEGFIQVPPEAVDQLLTHGYTTP